MDNQHKYAMQVIHAYIKSKPEPYYTEEKMSYYRWGLNEAMSTVRHSKEAPLVALERNQVKYDSWAHQCKPTSYIYACVAAAYDDVIHVLMNSINVKMR